MAEEHLSEAAPRLRNPGAFDELHRKVQDIFPLCFEGAKVSIQKGLSSHFQVSHTLNISSTNTGYRFGATYVGDQKYEQDQAFPVLLGDTDPAGNTTATVIHQFGPKWRTKLTGHVNKGQLAGAQASLEWRADLCTAGVTIANTNVLNDSGLFVLTYLRRLTEKLDVGIEYTNIYGPQIPGRTMTNLSYGARYTAKDWTGAATLSPTTSQLSYYHKQAPNIAFGCEFTANFMQRDALATFAYQVEIPEEGVTMRASIDSNWTVGGVLEKRLSQMLPFTLALSGLFNHEKNAGKFGLGLIIG